MLIFSICDEMFYTIVDKLVMYLVKNSGRTDEQIQKIEFALKSLLSELVKIVLLVIVFVMLRKVELFMICLCTFLLLRTFMGGLHRNTILGCFFQSLITFAIIVFCAEKTDFMGIGNIVYMLGILSICRYAPIISEKRGNMYSELEKMKFKFRAICSLFLLSIVVNFCSKSIGNAILCTIIFQSLEIAIVAITRKEERRTQHG